MLLSPCEIAVEVSRKMTDDMGNPIDGKNVKNSTNTNWYQIKQHLAYLGTYLGVPNMVKWGVPEKILQNAVQTRWS